MSELERLELILRRVATRLYSGEAKVLVELIIDELTDSNNEQRTKEVSDEVGTF